MPYEPIKIYFAAKRREKEAEQERIYNSIPDLTEEEIAADLHKNANEIQQEMEEFFADFKAGDFDPRNPIASPKLVLGDLFLFSAIAQQMKVERRGGLAAGDKSEGLKPGTASNLFDRLEKLLGTKLAENKRQEITVQGRNLAITANILAHWYGLVASTTDQESLNRLLVEEFRRLSSTPQAAARMDRAGQQIFGPDDLPF